MDVTVDEDVCIGAGQCEMIAPAIFEVGDDGISHVIGPVEDEDQARQAVDNCPSGAIRELDAD